MKLIYTGSGTFTPENWLYNCTRNAACQKPYYMPLQTFDNLILYMDFPFGLPETIAFYAEDCNGNETQLFYNNWVIAQRPNSEYYGVFTEWITPISDIPATRFYIKAVASTGSVQYFYLTNQFENNSCDKLKKLSSCYNDTETTSDALDCNNVYYGLPANPDPLGNPLLRYYHNAYVRKCDVKENKNKFQLTYFNSLKAYKNGVTKNYLLQFELVPGFYKDVLMGVFYRGNIQIDDVDYRLDESQEVDLADDDLRWWQLDLNLVSTCNQYFSCKPTVCVPAPFPVTPPTCTDNYTGATFDGADEGFYNFTLTDGSLDAGDVIEWQILDVSSTVIASGTSTDETITASASLDLDNSCYIFRWRKHCVNDILTAYNSINFGNCDGAGGDCKTCGDFFEYNWNEITFHQYDDVCMQFENDAAIAVGWSSYDRPNRFTVYDGVTLLSTSGWVGYAPYAGPWGSSLSTVESGTLNFSALAGHTYTLRVEAGNGDPDNFLTDGAGIGISGCDDTPPPPPEMPKVTSSSVTSFNYNPDTQNYMQCWAHVDLDSAVDVETTFELTYEFHDGLFDFTDQTINVVVAAGETSGDTYGGFSNDSAGGGCVSNCDNTNVDLNGHGC